MNYNENLTLVTIITVVLNGESFIEETILSVTNQTYKNIEYIIIDGGSQDGTIEIIKKHEAEIAYWISEPDSGIYDAMNKGIKAAHGEWFNFLNAGDSFIDNKLLEMIFSVQLKDYTLLYGDVRVLKKSGYSHYHKASILKDDMSIIKGMTVCHQAIFYHKQIMELYDASLRLKGEWKHLIKMTRKKNFSPLKFNTAFVYYRSGGLGAQLIKFNHAEHRKVLLEEFGKMNYLKNIPFFIYRALRQNFKLFLIKLSLYKDNI